uniref:Polysaccharide pyruvyl transferase domain-containing protein n=1 Tax=Loigolactobacillus rennini TaxID=238013 RepID=A0A1K2I9L3_9LACO|nr:conserved hypothetical protein [Loigolactobacillus rennini]
MKKIGILTLQGNFNYGNRLQNYALEQVVLSLNYDVDTLVLPEKKKIRLKKTILKLMYHFSKRKKQYLKMLKAKTPILTPFTKAYLHSRQFDKANLKSYTAFFVGSDQVWNPSYTGNDTRYFLDFAPRKKRFAYAASFGVSNIPAQFHSNYRKYLNDMHKISVREEQGINIINSLSDAKAELIADPTLLLSQKKWNELANKVDIKFTGNYVLIYTLSSLSPDKYSKIKEYAESKNAKIITILGDEYNPDYWIPSPFEFLYAIKNATSVFTDSFHCTVFSIIFNTPFIIFNRSNGEMISRIDTLLAYFGFQRNKFSTQTNINDVLSKTSFTGVAKVLAKEKAKGYVFIQDCLASV